MWSLAHTLSIAVIDALPERSARVPGLRAQAVRAATSVAANLAEGSSRATPAEFLPFVEVSLGSLNELDTDLLTARDAKVITEAVYADLQKDLVLLRRMLLSLIRTIQRQVADATDRRRAVRKRARRGVAKRGVAKRGGAKRAARPSAD